MEKELWSLGRWSTLSTNYFTHVHISNHFTRKHISQKGARHIWWWVRSSWELLWPNCPVQHVHKVLTDYFTFEFHIHRQGAGGLWNKVNVHVQRRPERRSDWVDSVKVGEGGGGRFLPNQSDRVLCQTFLQRHGLLIGNTSTLFHVMICNNWKSHGMLNQLIGN